MDNKPYEKPRLVELSSGQGFLRLNTVEYKNRFLYSKYNPTRAIKDLIQRTVILPGSVVVLSSPCLWYGLEDLTQKLDSCKIIAIEADSALFDFSLAMFAENNNSDYSIKNHSEKPVSTDTNENSTFTNFKQIEYFNLNNLEYLDSYFRKLIATGKFRRVINIDFSAGTQFTPELYSHTISGLTEINERFWKNRITIAKFGRLYSKNIFRNLRNYTKSIELYDLKKTIDKPVIVCGAGESLDQLFKTDSNGIAINKDFFNSNFFIIAVDAAVKTLQDRGIKVGAAVLVESQLAIKKAFIGTDFTNTILFKDLCSRPDLYVENKTCFFISEFADCEYLKGLENGIISSFIPPLGSVGLTAIEIACTLRKTNDIPVILTGLDFAYSIGNTHAKGTPASISLHSLLNRILPAGNYGASFGKSNFTYSKYASSEIMKMYATTLKQKLSNSNSNIYNCSSFGLDIGVANITPEYILSLQFEKTPETDLTQLFAVNNQRRDLITRYLEEEKTALEKARDLLSKGITSSYLDSSTSLENQLEQLLQKRDYLYQHFPDGFTYTNDLSFLKRLRAEIDFFLKQINWSLKK